jgi:DNA-binding NtrC family response regulator
MMKILFIAAPGSPDLMPGDSSGSSSHSTERVSAPEVALSLLRQADFDAVLAMFPLPGWLPAELLDELQRANRGVPVIVCDPGGTTVEAVRLTKLGAFHYFDGDVSRPALAAVLESVAEHRRGHSLAGLQDCLSREPWSLVLVGRSRAMRDVAELIRMVGPRKCTVLISGETGTGKELVARAIHLAGPRAHLPMVAVNCSALPESLLETELFGHTKGAFTGALTQRTGRFEQAHKSTLFLDEIAAMSLELQAKLLRVLQEREFQRVGSSESVKVDIRVIAATNVDLVARVRQGTLREDLYYRLNVVPIFSPPLRERPGDIPLLARHFIEKVCRNEEIPLKNISTETLRRLAAHSWPGNVRQLENAVEMAVALSGERDTLFPGDFPLPSSVPHKPVSAAAEPLVCVPDEGLDYQATVGRIERHILEQALRKSRGNKKQAAELLRLKRTTFAAKLKSLQPAPVC